jgi:hypothetical protein
MFIMRFYRSTEYTQFTSLFFTLLSLNPLDLLAMKTSQTNVPKSPAVCDFDPRNLLARTRRHCNSRYWLAREPPFPAQNPQARPGPPPFPPPLATPCSGGGGRGQETDPARPCILNRYFNFHFPYMNDYIFL